MASLKSLGFHDFARAATEVKTVCRFCGKAPENVSTYEDAANDDTVVLFKCHGKFDRHVFRHKCWEELRFTEIEALAYNWPRLCFDLYTMIPLPPTMGHDDDTDKMDAAWSAFGSAGLLSAAIGGNG